MKESKIKGTNRENIAEEIICDKVYKIRNASGMIWSFKLRSRDAFVSNESAASSDNAIDTNGKYRNQSFVFCCC